MDKRLDYNSKKMEIYARRMLSLHYNPKYLNYHWNNKEDNFDFTCDSDKAALEITTVLPINTRRAIEYEKALDKGKIPNALLVEDAIVDADGELLLYHGGSMDECRADIFMAIDSKNTKALNRTEMLTWNHELCLCVVEGGLFDQTISFSFITKNFKQWLFSKIFIITCNYIFIITKDNIERVDKKVTERNSLLNK